MADETVREVCAEIRTVKYAPPEYGEMNCYLCDVADRIIASHDREITEKDDALKTANEMARIAVQSAQARFDETMAAKDAEIARLKAALKPVLECDLSNATYAGVAVRVFDAVRTARRVMMEGANND